jgi:transposase InsO family protein
MDYFSLYLDIAHLSNITSEQVIGKLKNIFARLEIPKIFVSENGTQFTSSFKEFAKDYFIQSFSSPHYPQANGQAESGGQDSNISYDNEILSVH